MDQIIYSPQSLGSALKRQRKIKNLSQKQAGDAFRLNQTTVSSIEQGAPGTRLENLFRMLAALDLTMVIRPRKEIAPKGDDW